MWDEPDGQWSRPPAFGDGAAGLVSTADDLLAFSRMLLAGGGSVLPARRRRAMCSDQLTDAQKALGGLGPGFFAHKSWGFCQAVYDGGAFGWNGGFGTSWLVDPARDLTVIVLTQRVFESAELPRCTATSRRPPRPANRHSRARPRRDWPTGRTEYPARGVECGSVAALRPSR